MSDSQPTVDDDADESETSKTVGGDGSVRTDAERVAATYAWEYFKYHAQQRQSVFRFFLVIAGALFAAYFATFHRDADSSFKEARTVIAGAVAIASFLFWRLDVRSYQLVKLAEQYLAIDERKLAKSLSTEDIRLIGRSNDEKPTWIPLKWFASFRLVYAWIFFLVGALGLYLVNWGRAWDILRHLCSIQ